MPGENRSHYFAYRLLLWGGGLSALSAAAAFLLLRYAETKNKFNYPDRGTRILAGFIKLWMLLLHTREYQLGLPSTGAGIFALGPHRIGVDPLAVASSMEGTPLRFFATTDYHGIWFVRLLLEHLLTIPVVTGVRNTESQNAAENILRGEGRVGIFPQGGIVTPKNLSMIYSGAARMAVNTNTPIYVIRIGGAWSTTNRLIPGFVRDNTLFRVLGTLLVPNDIHPDYCYKIDIHTKDNQMSPEEKIDEINAILYFFFRNTDELTEEEIAGLKQQVERGEHRELWKKRCELYQNQRKERDLRGEYDQIERGLASGSGLSPA